MTWLTRGLVNLGLVHARRAGGDWGVFSLTVHLSMIGIDDVHLAGSRSKEHGCSGPYGKIFGSGLSDDAYQELSFRDEQHVGTRTHLMDVLELGLVNGVITCKGSYGFVPIGFQLGPQVFQGAWIWRGGRRTLLSWRALYGCTTLHGSRSTLRGRYKPLRDLCRALRGCCRQCMKAVRD